MAVTIDHTPGAIRRSGDPFVIVASSDKTSEKEFAYRIDILEDGSTSVLDEILVKQANPTGNLVVDLSPIIDDLLEPDFGNIAKQTVENNSEDAAVKTYAIHVGEQYQNSSGVLTNYTGAATETVGDAPAIDSGDVIVIKGRSENDLHDTTDGLSFSDGDIFGIRHQEYYNGQYIHLSYWDGSDNTIKTYAGRFTTNGAQDLDLDDDADTQYATVIVADDNYLGNEHFTWWRPEGGWQVWTLTEEGSNTTKVDRQVADSTQLQWGGSVSSLRHPDNDKVFKSGRNNYRNTFTTTYRKNSAWLTEAEAEEFSGLFQSRWVYKQKGTDLIPIEITKSSYKSYSDEREQQLFQYEVEYRHANNKIRI